MQNAYQRVIIEKERSIKVKECVWTGQPFILPFESLFVLDESI